MKTLLFVVGVALLVSEITATGGLQIWDAVKNVPVANAVDALKGGIINLQCKHINIDATADVQYQPDLFYWVNNGNNRVMQRGDYLSVVADVDADISCHLDILGLRVDLNIHVSINVDILGLNVLGNSHDGHPALLSGLLDGLLGGLLGALGRKRRTADEGCQIIDRITQLPCGDTLNVQIGITLKLKVDIRADLRAKVKAIVWTAGGRTVAQGEDCDLTVLDALLQDVTVIVTLDADVKISASVKLNVSLVAKLARRRRALAYKEHDLLTA